ncbi:hypothetical protein NWO25_16240 [Enterococcus lactis]|nr:hypothetical protein [Enterococcus lactis]
MDLHKSIKEFCSEHATVVWHARPTEPIDTNARIESISGSK